MCLDMAEQSPATNDLYFQLGGADLGAPKKTLDGRMLSDIQNYESHLGYI